MKKFLVGMVGMVGLVALGITAPASAADMAARPYIKAPSPMIVAIYDWSGLYVGFNGGGAWSRKCWTNTSVFGVATIPNVNEGCHDASGGVAGGQIGYRWQAASWVFGLEAQGDWANLRGSNISLGAPFVTNRSKVDALGLFTGQVGYAWNNALLYVKGGAAVTSDKYEGFTTAAPNTVFDRASETRWGGVVGVGLEYAFAPNWSVGVNYDHMFMGRRNLGFTTVAAPATITRSDTIRQDVDMVTARINYRWGGPVVAKY